MPAIVRTEWSGTTGGPGLTQMAFSGGFNDAWDQNQTDAAVAAVRDFWSALTAQLPNELRLQVSPVVDVYDGIGGDLISSFTATTPPAIVLGIASGSYAGGAGLKMNWNTGVIAFGRRVRGHTYIVPAAGNAFTDAGLAGATATTAANNAASAMLGAVDTAGCPMVVWSRPKVVPIARNGFQSVVTGGSLGSKSAILRGRRD